jgi:hypothetical protein
MLDGLKKKISQAAKNAEKANEESNIQWNKIKLPEEERNARYDICKSCEWFFTPTSTCKKCGCFMAIKTYMPYQSCPIGKWKNK